MMTVEQIAWVCHEANRAYCASIGDFSQPTWAGAEAWRQKSAMAGVQFMLDNPDAQPSARAQHEAWMADKIADGWKLGPVKDADKKEHPQLVPYDELPVEQKRKDWLFQAVVRALVAE